MVAKKDGGERRDLVEVEQKRGAGDLVEAGEVDILDPNDDEFEADDVAVPRVRILQDLSPQTKKTKPEYVEGAKPGMLFNSATNRLYDAEHAGVILIPCVYRASFVEWLPNRGGFVGDRSEEPGIKELWRSAFNNRKSDPSGKNQPLIANGNVLDRTADHYVLIAEDKGEVLTFDDFEEAVLTLGGKQMKKSRAWNTKVRDQRVKLTDGRTVRVIPPMFAYRAVTGEESNDVGTWMGITIADLRRTPLLPAGRELYERAKSFRQLVLEGKRRATADGPSDDATDDADIPF